MDYKLQVFDFEVLQDWWCVTFFDGKTYKTIINDRLELIDYTLKNKNDTIFVGFNNKAFDDPCWKCIWYGINPYVVVKHVVIDGHSVYDKDNKLSELNYKKNIGINTFDIMRVAAPVGQCPSLKAIQGNMGMSIVLNESIENKTCGLTEDEKREVIKYNCHDCYSTYVFFNKMKSEYDAYMELIKYYNLPLNTLKITKSAMLETIFNDKLKNYTPPQSFLYKAPSFIPDSDIKKQCEQVYDPETKFRTKIDWYGDEFTFGLGGGHSATKNFFIKLKDGKVLVVADVVSYYPNLMANKTNPELRYIDNVLPWELFRSMIDLRVEAKAKKLPIANPLKIPINGASGRFRFKSSKLYDYTAGISMCLTGQLGIYTICCNIMKTIPNAKIFNINTDGLYAIIDEKDIDTFKNEINTFEKKAGIEFEVDVIKSGVVAQKDVNNYVIYDGDKDKFKLKGSMVSNYTESTDWKKYDMAIVDIALVNKLVFNTPISKTVLDAFNNNEVRKFQFIRKASKKFDGLFECRFNGEPDQRKYPEKIKQVQRVCRVFASSDKNAPILLKKKGSTYYIELEALPSHQYVYNGDLKDFDIRKIGLDVQWYINEAQRRYELFTKGDTKSWNSMVLKTFGM